MEKETMSQMPSKGAYTAWLVVGFVTGVLWGLLALAPFKRMNRAIAADDADEAWRNAGRVRLFALIGITLNVVYIIFYILRR